MKPDRMAAYEAPRQNTIPDRPQTKVTLRFRGRFAQTCEVSIPSDMPMPDLLTYGSRYFVRRPDKSYSEAAAWPIIKGLDFVKQ